MCARRLFLLLFHSFNHLFFRSVLDLFGLLMVNSGYRRTKMPVHSTCVACQCSYVLSISILSCRCWCCRCSFLLLLFSVLCFYQSVLGKLSEYHHASEAADSQKTKQSRNGNHMFEPWLFTLLASSFISPGIFAVTQRSQEKLSRSQTEWHFWAVRHRPMAQRSLLSQL